MTGHENSERETTPQRLWANSAAANMRPLQDGRVSVRGLSEDWVVHYVTSELAHDVDCPSVGLGTIPVIEDVWLTSPILPHASAGVR